MCNAEVTGRISDFTTSTRQFSGLVESISKLEVCKKECNFLSNPIEHVMRIANILKVQYSLQVFGIELHLEQD